MLLGFISLLLVVFQTRISKLCISKELANKWLPCEIKKDTSSTAHFQTFFNSFVPGAARRLLAEDSASSTGSCKEVLQILFYFYFHFSCNLFFNASIDVIYILCTKSGCLLFTYSID
jgi:mlo protein